MKHAYLIAILSLLLGAVGSSSLQGSALAHERLRLRNTFRSPEEVVNYYCARDASGFVWSGLLDSERSAFTTWNEAPQQDSFLIAKDYQIAAPTKSSANADSAIVEVKYSLVAIGDAHGTRMPAPRSPYLVRFDLKKVAGVWKISKPDPKEISPVVLESKFPYGNP
jgi:hypothetical protein